MMNTKTVLVYGNSLPIAGVTAQLRSIPGLHIERLQTADTLANHCPAVLICDLSAVGADVLIGWLTECSRLTLVGLDMNQSRVIVFSTGSLHISSIGELADLVQQIA